MASEAAVDKQRGAKSSGRAGNIIALLLFALFAIAVLISAFVRAKQVNPWIDEIFVLWILRSFPASHIIDALKIPLDTPPPFYYWLLKGFCHFLGTNVFAIRLPSILGYVLFPLGTFLIVRKRVELPIALFATAASCISGASYAMTMGRPYALVMGLYALCAYLWVDFPSSKRQGWRAVFTALLVVAMLSVHFLSCVEVMALGIAEVVRSIRTRRVQWRYWAGLVGGSLWLIASLPVIAPIYRLTHASVHASGYYAKATMSALFALTHSLFVYSAPEMGVLYLALVLVPLLVFAKRRSRVEPAKITEDESTFRNVDILSFASLTIPALIYLMASVLTGSLNQRYFLSAWLGVVLLLVHVLSRLQARVCIANALLAFLVLQAPREIYRRFESNLNEFASLQPMATKPLPIALPYANDFFQLRELSDAGNRDRFVFVGHPAGTDDPDPEPEIIAYRFKQAMPELPVYSAEEFLRQHDHFYVFYSSSNREGFTDWLIAHASVQAVKRNGKFWLLEATTSTKPEQPVTTSLR